MTDAGSAYHLGHHRALDGLRGVAILLVLVNHGAVIGNGFGFIAVNTFFVLSGFLITSLLVSEWETTGAINVKFFYIRRALRLFPALLAMLLLYVLYILLITSGHKTWEHLRASLWALFYFTNWARAFDLGSTLDLGHTWSLSIEEQFYFIWPWLLRSLLKKSSRSSLLCWLLLGVVVSLSIRGFHQWAGPLIPRNGPARLTDGLDTRADSLLIGCIAGVLVSSKRIPTNLLGKALLPASFLSVAGLWLLCLANHLDYRMVYLGWLMASVFAAVVIVQIVTTSGTFIHRILENQILVFIGSISYGLYVWHLPILGAMMRHNLPWQHLGYLLPVLPVVLASYYLIERPCLRLKSRFQKVS